MLPCFKAKKETLPEIDSVDQKLDYDFTINLTKTNKSKASSHVFSEARNFLSWWRLKVSLSQILIIHGQRFFTPNVHFQLIFRHKYLSEEALGVPKFKFFYYVTPSIGLEYDKISYSL